MNRYPVWKYAIILIALLVGGLYTLPNFFGEAPAVQVSAAKASQKIDATTLARVQEALKAAGLQADAASLEGSSVRVRLDSTDTQLKAKDALQKALVPDAVDPAYVVALNLISRSPAWLASLNAAPMYLGLDLRGGVHFMLQVDMPAALTKKAESLAGDLRTVLREKNIRHGGITRNGQTVELRLRDAATLEAAKRVLADQFSDLQTSETQDGSDFRLSATIKPQAARNVQDQALKQNITTLHNRINELGVAEPVIQQQGLDRIVVQLPGVQDTAKAKDILGRTATLEVRMVEDDPAKVAEALAGNPPAGYELLDEVTSRGTGKILLKKDVELTGDNINSAQPGFDQNGGASVDIGLDSTGAEIFRTLTAENIGKRMAMVD